MKPFNFNHLRYHLNAPLTTVVLRRERSWCFVSKMRWCAFDLDDNSERRISRNTFSMIQVDYREFPPKIFSKPVGTDGKPLLWQSTDSYIESWAFLGRLLFTLNKNWPKNKNLSLFFGTGIARKVRKLKMRRHDEQRNWKRLLMPKMPSDPEC